MNKIILIIYIILSIFFILISIRGNVGSPSSNELLDNKWTFDGPFELSPERGRFALTYSVIEDNSLFFSKNIAKFAAPDVAISKGRFVSLFAPALSYLIIPGYLIGKLFGLSQIGAFSTIAIFAFINMILLRKISINLGASPLAATIASLIFMFGTPAYAYGVNLYQHHVSTFLMLISIFALLNLRPTLALLITFFSFSAAIPLDYPNLFFLAPISIYAIGKIIDLKKVSKSISLKINIYNLLTPVIMIIPISLFLLFNYLSYGNPFRLSGTLPTNKNMTNIEDLSSAEIRKVVRQQYTTKPADKYLSVAANFFKTRDLINGLYIHTISPDRGIILYTPVVLFGVVGFIFAYKKRMKMLNVMFAIVSINIILYSMWGDPWGGWAFGSRYLIPSYAILSIFIALLLTYFNKNIFLLLFFTLIAFYSVAINTLGAITTSAIPPKVEVLQLEKLSGVVQKYTYARNWDNILSGLSKSFVYQTYLRDYLSAVEFFYILTMLICALIGVLIIYFYIDSTRNRKNIDHV